MKNGSWIVKMRCEVEKEVIVENCTEEAARRTPWDHAVDERELQQMNWTIISVEPNE